MSNTPIDRLRAWAAKSDIDLANEYREDDPTLQTVIEMLGDSDLQRKKMTSENFVPTVRRLEHLLKAGSRKLGEALADAGEQKDKGNLREARRILESFIDDCPSRFYIDIARKYIEQHLN